MNSSGAVARPGYVQRTLIVGEMPEKELSWESIVVRNL
jgi:hypothetical protein